MIPLDLATGRDCGRRLDGPGGAAGGSARWSGGIFSPCVVPLLPGYLSYATGLGAAEVVEGSPRRGRMLAGASLFVLGFAAVFVTTGVVAGSAGRLLAEYRDVITRVLGVVIIMLGLIFAGVLRIGQRDLRIIAFRRSALPRHRWSVWCLRSAGHRACHRRSAWWSTSASTRALLYAAAAGIVYALGLGIPS